MVIDFATNYHIESLVEGVEFLVTLELDDSDLRQKRFLVKLGCFDLLVLTVVTFCFILSTGEILRIRPHWNGIAQGHRYLRTDRAKVVLRGRGNQEFADTGHEFIEVATPLGRLELLRILLHKLLILLESS